jgi:hypothetical protein
MDRASLRRGLELLLLSLFAVFVHGYHLGTDDAAIYVPAVKKIYNPHLYPFGAEFFMQHERLSIFSYLVVASARLFHLQIDTAIFLWHIFGIFLLLVAGWRIACCCFTTDRARWAAVCLLAALLTVPVAGTALVIADPYLTARSLSTPASLFIIDSYLRKSRAGLIFWTLLMLFVHPQMVVYVFGFLLFLYATDRWNKKSTFRREGMALAGAVVLPSRWPAGFNFHPISPAYREVLDLRTFFFPDRWHWYEWLGAILPLLLLYLFSRIHPRNTSPVFRRIARATIPFGLVSIAVFLILGSSDHLVNFVRLQPMRSFQVIYILFYILLGGLLGEYVLQARTWRWLALFVPLAFGMGAYGKSMYPASRAIEWPWAQPRNPWVQAFLWIRHNTPTNAVFALDPHYMLIPGEDTHGFRAIAERSVLADYVKDSGAAAMFPQLTQDWARQQAVQAGWRHFQAADFTRLAQQTPVTWVVVQIPVPIGLDCPYRNLTVAVCHILHK